MGREREIVLNEFFYIYQKRDGESELICSVLLLSSICSVLLSRLQFRVHQKPLKDKTDAFPAYSAVFCTNT